MAMPLAGTFDYFLTVPKRIGDGGFSGRAVVREPFDLCGDDLADCRLVGVAPVVDVTDAGLTPDASPQRPWVARSRITLTASTRRQASVAAASFHIDKALTSCMREGDVLHLSRTSCAGLGLSVLRDGTLVVAVGAVTSVPLGSQIVATIPSDLIAQAKAAFHNGDPTFELAEWPLDITINGTRNILGAGRRTVGPYRVFVVHGYVANMPPGTDACAAIFRRDVCPDVAADASAMLMDRPDALSMSPWNL